MLKIVSNILTTVANFYVPSVHIVLFAITNNIRFIINEKIFPTDGEDPGRALRTPYTTVNDRIRRRIRPYFSRIR
jgi:hypothetical protein